MFTKSPSYKVNYLATIVKIDEFKSHANADKLKIATIFANNIITGIDAQPGLFVYFPLECAISNEYLKYSNSYRETELNADKTAKGFFEYHGRVRALRLRGLKSEGYIVPVANLEKFIKDVLNEDFKITDKFVGTDFDTIFNHQICKKYVSKQNIASALSKKKTKGNVKKYESKLIEGQFNFHEDTSHLKREVNKISPDDYISVIEKYHGCNFVVSHVLTKRKLSVVEKVAKFFGAKVQESEYGMLYSSRAVIKNHVMNDDKEHNHYYDSDVWKIVADKIFPSLPKGISVTGEIVGFTPNGSAIQKDYDYGCSPNTLDFYIFKVTYTSVDGRVHVFSHREMVDFCNKYGFKIPEVHYYGKAKDLFPELDTTQHWHDSFLQKMIDTFLEKQCKICKNKVPAEGVILRKESPFEWDAFKLKAFSFLERETKALDKGEVDMEEAEKNQDGVEV